MKAIGYKQAGAINALDSFILLDVEKPKLKVHDILVQVKGISVNPVDVKVRASMGPESGAKIIGYDASGIVAEVGSAVTQYKIGDEVFYAGDITRQGTNAEYHVVDERIVGRKPKSLNFPEAAGLPLTSITAWEILFDSLKISEGGGAGESILIVGGAGGVGSILIQLAKKLTQLTVIASASRPDSIEWVKKMGADYVVNHRNSLSEQVKELGLQPKYVASLNATDQHFNTIVDLIKPRGHIALIDDPANLNINIIKPKALSFSWEFMFARSMFNTDDINAQYHLLNRVSELIDDGTLVSTVTNNLGNLSVENLKEAHRIQETGTVIGKNVLGGFE
ncbi:zinc-binding alcohol dehydrogenase family protein [Saccharicrinis aurantiacus]|uniref:zinc-binding alcohol dehydrogenase family protein n=1 Tax=Saccharicrinis aurantiacus TaxID=1849719 RepID=UPI0024939DD9|nr:zinc-binding alcohol dehydrogenase family protein [Saccharicrinis aurantiacus]